MRRIPPVAHVLFVCLHNAGRSQMSEALFAQAAGGRHTAASAGTTPAERVHPEVEETMREVGIDLSGRIPRLLTRELAEQADIVITMGCGDRCPYIPGKRYIDWELPDPAGRPIEEVRATRDEIKRRVDELITELDAADGHANPDGHLARTGVRVGPPSPTSNPLQNEPRPPDAERPADRPLAR